MMRGGERRLRELAEQQRSLIALVVSRNWRGR